MEEFMQELNKGNMCLAPFKDIPENEELIKEYTKKETSDDASLHGGAKSLNFPLDEELINFNVGVSNGKEMDCISNSLSGQKNKTTEWCLFGRSY